MALIAPGTRNVPIHAKVNAALIYGELVKLVNDGGTPRLDKATAAHEAHAVVTTMNIAASTSLQTFENEITWLGPCFTCRAGEALALTDAGANLISDADGELVKSGTAEREWVFIPWQSINNSDASAADGDQIVAMFYPLTLDTDT